MEAESRENVKGEDLMRKAHDCALRAEEILSSGMGSPESSDLARTWVALGELFTNLGMVMDLGKEMESPSIVAPRSPEAFPDNPTPGTSVVFDGETYVWKGFKWIRVERP